MSWRDDAAPPVQGDLDLLAEEALAWAKRFLAKGRGTLVLFAVRLLPDEKTDVLFVDPREGDSDPTPDAVMNMLYEIATVMRQRGVAIVSVVDTSIGDAVRVALEHSDGGPALVLLQPFRTTRKFRRSVEVRRTRSTGRQTSDLSPVDRPPIPMRATAHFARER
jgi:hypothetical protein